MWRTDRAARVVDCTARGAFRGSATASGLRSASPKPAAIARSARRKRVARRCSGVSRLGERVAAASMARIGTHAHFGSSLPRADSCPRRRKVDRQRDVVALLMRFVCVRPPQERTRRPPRRAGRARVSGNDHSLRPRAVSALTWKRHLSSRHRRARFRQPTSALATRTFCNAVTLSSGAVYPKPPGARFEAVELHPLSTVELGDERVADESRPAAARTAS
jgi:hypothetical protein